MIERCLLDTHLVGFSDLIFQSLILPGQTGGSSRSAAAALADDIKRRAPIGISTYSIGETASLHKGVLALYLDKGETGWVSLVCFIWLLALLLFSSCSLAGSLVPRAALI